MAMAHGREIWPFIGPESNQDVSLDKEKSTSWKILNAYWVQALTSVFLLQMGSINFFSNQR